MTNDPQTIGGAIRLIVADDHAVLRAGLRLLLEAETDMTVVGEAGDAASALALAEQLKPDVVLLDLTMPGASGLAVIAQLRQVSERLRILILTMHDDEAYLRQALAAGASGYLLKKAADVELLSAIRAVHGGGVYLHPDHARGLLDAMVERARTDRKGEAATKQSLSPREEELLRLIALGHTNQQVARQLYLSVKTVETYRSRLMAKLGLANRAELVRYALQRGMLQE